MQTNKTDWAVTAIVIVLIVIWSLWSWRPLAEPLSWSATTTPHLIQRASWSRQPVVGSQRKRVPPADKAKRLNDLLVACGTIGGPATGPD